MFANSHWAHRFFAVVLLAVTTTIASSAQYNQPPDQPTKSANNPLTMQMVKTGLYVISGGGANSVLRLSANGLIVVNGKLPGNYDFLSKKVRRISDQPVRFLVVTDYQESHTGNNGKFLAEGAVIIGQENVVKNLANYNPPSGKIIPPNKTYDREDTLRLGGVEAKLLHFGNAYTNGDTVVYFPNLKAVAIGDLYAATPIPDFSAGGSLVGWGPVLAQILTLDFDVAIPSTGPTVARADLETLKTKIDNFVTHATQLVQKGVPKDQLMAQLKTDANGWQFDFTGDQLDRFYAELGGTK